RGDGGRSDSFYGNLKITSRVASQLNTSLTLSAAHIVQDAKPPDPHPNVITDATGTHYIFAYLNRKELSLTARVDYTISTTLTLQLYAQPFVGKGTSSVRELPHVRVGSLAVRRQGNLLERAGAREPRCRRLRCSLSAVRGYGRHEPHRRRQLQAVPLERGVALGVPPGLDALRRMDPGSTRFRRRRRPGVDARQLPAHLRPAPRQHVPGEGVILDQ